MRLAATVALTAVTALMLSACGGGGESGQGAAAADATVDVRLVLEPTSLDLTTVSGAALEQLLLDNVYQGLLTRSPEGEIRPQLAQSVQTSPDGLTYTFPLKPNLRFADGSPLTAADVVWSYQRVLAPDSTNPNAKDFADVSAVTAPDPSTVRIALTKRDSNLTFALTNRAGAVLKKDTDPSTLAERPNGSGPYVVQQWNRGSTITLARNDNYWGEKPKVASVVLHYITDNNAANNAQLTGETDVETAPDATLLSAFAGREDEFTIAEGITSDKFTLGINNTRGPLADVRVRRAIRQAIDKDGLITILGGTNKRIGSGVAPTDPWFEDLTAIDPYDPAAARRLLAESGHAGGLTLSLQIPNIYPDSIGTYVASQLKQVGITVNLQPVEFATWLDKVYKKADYDLSVVDHAEPRDIANYADPTYYWRYDSKAVQDLVTRAGAAATDAERDTLYEQAARQISTDAANDWLFNTGARTVIRTGVEGFPTSSNSSRLDLSGLSATEPS